ncbi:hypothetical protein ACJJTC_002762 [Scirpophaga incertulas]
MPVCEVPPEKVWELINVNVGAVTCVSRLVLPGMAARGAGVLVCVSSGAELQPLPLMAIYAATKAYVRSLAAAVRSEYGARGVRVQLLSPYFVATKINAFSARLVRGHALVPDAAQYARSAAAALARADHTTGFWLHGLQYFFVSLAPEWARIKIGHFMNQQFRDEYLNNNKVKAH